MNRPNPDSTRNEFLSITIAIGSVVLGFVVVWLAKNFVEPIDGSVLIALILLPLLVYLIASGKLAEFKAPGGIEAKFIQTAAESVRPESETIAYDDLRVIAKEGIRSLIESNPQKFDASEPLVMTMTIGSNAHYNRIDVAEYLRVLSQFRNFKFVVFLDTNAQFVAYMPAWALRQMIDTQELVEEFLHAINVGQTAQVLRYPGVIRKTISTKSTNAEALREMQEQHIEALVVIDEQRRLRGVVEREQVLSRMILALVR